MTKTDVELSAAEYDFLLRVSEGRTLRPATRAEDRVRQRVRKAGLAEVVMNPRRWELTQAGRALLGEK